LTGALSEGQRSKVMSFLEHKDLGKETKQMGSISKNGMPTSFF